MIESAEEFVRLRTSEFREEYSRAANDCASAEVWLEIIEGFPEMRPWVAHNKNVLPEILETLARDPSPAVRSVVATKNKLSSELFLLLAQDPDEGVRARLCYNKKVPPNILQALVSDRSRLVAEAAEARQRNLGESFNRE